MSTGWLMARENDDAVPSQGGGAWLPAACRSAVGGGGLYPVGVRGGGHVVRLGLLYAEGDPVNQIDPSGLAPWDALGKVGDVIGAGAKVFQGDAKGLVADVAGFFAGAAFGSACESVMLGGSIPTAGASAIGGQAVCFSGSWAAGQVTEARMEDNYFRRARTTSRLFMFSTIFAICGACIGLALTVSGKPAGLGVVAIFAVVWGVGYLARRRVTRDEL
ncbi:hypothetical protein [Streptomyces alboniger]|uniref:hypothetical protein n=1 Tax=Streptomyces alboniger TaxID=132473 RepID=UPI0018F867D5|nr:hypothetical protein [Streptomyces alboniger]